MAGGHLDSRGIWQYGEDDSRDLFSELLNIGQESTSDAIGAVFATLNNLTEYNKLSPVLTSGIVTAAAGWAVVSQDGRRTGGQAWVSVRMNRTGAAVPVDPDGQIGDQIVATFTASWIPAAGMAYAATPRYRLGAGFVSDNQLVLTHLGPGSTLNTNDQITMLAYYPLG